MGCGCHLRKINDGDLLLLAHHEIELIEITVDETVLCKSDDLIDQSVVDCLWVREAFNVDHRVGLNQRHTDGVSISFVGNRCLKASLVQGCHEGELLERGYTRHVEPIGRATLQVVTIVLHCAEGRATEPCELDDHGLSVVNRLAILVYFVPTVADVNIGLLSAANLLDQLFDVSTLHENFQRQVVVTLICQRVPAIVLARVEDQLVLQQQGNGVETIAALEASQGLNQGHGHELVVLHAHLNGSEHAEVILAQVLYQVRVQLHILFFIRLRHAHELKSLNSSQVSTPTGSLVLVLLTRCVGCELGPRPQRTPHLHPHRLLIDTEFICFVVGPAGACVGFFGVFFRQVLLVLLVIFVGELVFRDLYSQVASYFCREIVRLSLRLLLGLRVLLLLRCWRLVRVLLLRCCCWLLLWVVGIGVAGAVLARTCADILHFVDVVSILNFFLRQVVLLCVVVARANVLNFAQVLAVLLLLS